MKKLILFVMLLLGSISAFAQIEKPVKWEFAVQKNNPTEATIYLKATIRDGWHIYALDQKSNGPVETSFHFIPSASYTLVGKTVQPVPKSRFEKAFNAAVSFFERSVIFRQKVHLKSIDGAVHGTVIYMTCSDQKCLPPENLQFAIDIK